MFEDETFPVLINTPGVNQGGTRVMPELIASSQVGCHVGRFEFYFCQDFGTWWLGSARSRFGPGVSLFQTRVAIALRCLSAE